MKIALISPNSLVSNHSIRALSAILKNDGHDVTVIHLPKENGRELIEPGAFITPYPAEVIDDVISIIKDSDIVGITVMSQFLAVVVDLTKEIRKKTKSIVIWGGVHPTMEPEFCLDYVDCVCIGEGEEALQELARLMESNKSYYSTRNFWFRKGNQIVKNPLRPYIQDLDKLPFQDYSFEDHYVLWNNKVQPMIKEVIGVTYNTNMTRGCPYRCAFCCNEVFNNKYEGQNIFRKRSVDSLINELKLIKNSNSFIGWTRVKLVDDLFPALPLPTLREFAEKYKKEIDLPLSVCGWTSQTVTDAKVRTLIDAGMDVTRMGIQHGSERIRKLLSRVGSNEKILESARIFNRYKDRLQMTYDLITDNPYETRVDTLESLKLFSEIPRPYHISIFSLIPFPGTPVYEWAVRDKYLSGDWLTDLKSGTFGGTALSHEYKFTYQSNYYNNLYLIFQTYQLPKFLKKFMINHLFIKCKITYLPYLFLKAGIGIVRYTKLIKNPGNFKGFLQRGFQALKRGDFERIFKSLFRFKRSW